MTEWRIKEISNLTKISIRMLRHYDKIGLLKPSYRTSNGYRCYTEQDLAKIQQIIALRYFGFSLGTIKTILQKHHNVYAHLKAQQQALKKQSVHLQHVNGALSEILKRLSPSDVPNWNELIALIERYHMTETLRTKLKDTWAGKKLSNSQFEEYLFFYEKFPEEFAARDKIITKINNNEFGDPEGPDGNQVAKFMYDFAKKTKEFFTKQIKFTSSLMESIRTGDLTELEFTPEGASWMRHALLSYWLKRWEIISQSILENLKSDPKSAVGKKIAHEWIKLIDEYYSIGSRSFLIGVMLWNNLAKQKHELNELKILPSPQEMVKHHQIKLLFNPEATSWISEALEAHSK